MNMLNRPVSQNLSKNVPVSTRTGSSDQTFMSFVMVFSLLRTVRGLGAELTVSLLYLILITWLTAQVTLLAKGLMEHQEKGTPFGIVEDQENFFLVTEHVQRTQCAHSSLSASIVLVFKDNLFQLKTDNG